VISLSNIVLQRGPQRLLDDASLLIPQRQRAAIIGRNGSGKTSLFKALCGELSLEQGSIEMPARLRWSRMAQETPGLQRAAIDFVIDAHSEFRQLESRLAEAEASANNNLLAELFGQMETIDGYSVQHHAERLLSGLGFDTSQFTQPVASFSGGWRVRLNLAAALMQPSDLLLLDEPTNHLDLEATVWLEQWLKQYPGTLLLISHDRMFIDAVATSIISFEDRKLVSYSGNYSAYEKQRAERLALQQAMFEKQQRRKEQIEDFVRRFRAKATKAKQAQSRLKELSRMEEIAPAHVDSPFHFSFGETGQLPSHLLTA